MLLIIIYRFLWAAWIKVKNQKKQKFKEKNFYLAFPQNSSQPLLKKKIEIEIYFPIYMQVEFKRWYWFFLQHHT